VKSEGGDIGDIGTIPTSLCAKHLQHLESRSTKRSLVQSSPVQSCAVPYKQTWRGKSPSDASQSNAMCVHVCPIYAPSMSSMLAQKIDAHLVSGVLEAYHSSSPFKKPMHQNMAFTCSLVDLFACATQSSSSSPSFAFAFPFVLFCLLCLYLYIIWASTCTCIFFTSLCLYKYIHYLSIYLHLLQIIVLCVSRLQELHHPAFPLCS